MNPTDQQTEIVRRATKGERLFIRALAGCGKTTTLKLAATRLRPGLAIAFNRRAADELRAALPPAWKVTTFNALGMQVLFRTGIKPKLREDKLLLIARELGIPGKVLSDTIATARAARIHGVVPREKEVPPVAGLVPDKPINWQDAMRFAGAPDANITLARALLAESIRRVYKDGLIDFDDQVYMSAFFSSSFPLHPTILVDEAQDLSPLNIRQLQRLRAADAQLIAVGDPYQSIYGWRGAKEDAVDTIINLFGLEEALLTVTFRCTKLVVSKWADKIPEFTAAEANADGTFQSTSPYPDLSPDSAVLAATNAPLVRWAIELMDRNIPFQFISRDFQNAIERLHERSGGNLDQAIRWVRRRAERLRSMGGDPGPIVETGKIYTYLHFRFGADHVLDGAHQLLSGLRGPTFSTIYRAKGLEWSSVHILFNDDVRDFQNLHYVADTRTSNHLTYIEGFDD